jgi:murein DD-endopeptidase MepM/ murein hydrolase activator NlpD
MKKTGAFKMGGFLGVGAIILVALLIVGVGAYLLFTGPHNLDQYPGARPSPYRLPWTAGETHLCVQSNRGIVSHRGWDEFAYDFAMPVGTDVRASRAGKVIKVVDSNDGHGYHWPNNLITIQHDDGTQASYLHLKKDGSRVKAGDVVAQGQVIAASGHVGNSMLPHLHFHVTDKDRKSTQPISFTDVDKDAGIPRMFKSYTSGNTPAEPTTESR